MLVTRLLANEASLPQLAPFVNRVVSSLCNKPDFQGSFSAQLGHNFPKRGEHLIKEPVWGFSGDFAKRKEKDRRHHKIALKSQQK